MSKENLEKFLNQVTDSKELQARFGEEIETEDLIALGAESGCKFTDEDLKVMGELREGLEIGGEVYTLWGGTWCRW